MIKYVPYVGDSKRAMDEYTSEICMGGHNTIVLHNTCEDSLLATPIILDLVILAELCERIQVKTGIAILTPRCLPSMCSVLHERWEREPPSCSCSMCALFMHGSVECVVVHGDQHQYCAM